MADPQPTRGRRLGRPIGVAWFLVIVMMLAAAAWSISSKLTGWGMPHWLAIALSLMFDLAGLICAEYARRAIERGTPAGLPRLAILGFVLVSGAINWSHGVQVGGRIAGLGLASISGAVELLAELHRRDVRDEQRATRGLVSERLPHIPLIGWCMYPGRSWTTLRHAVGIRLQLLDPLQQPVSDPTPAPARAVSARPAPAAALSPAAGAAIDPPPPAEQPVATAPAPADEPPEPAEHQHADARHAAIRALYRSGYRPETMEMQDAVEDATGVRPSSSGARTLRTVVEAVEPRLSALPSRPTPIRRTAP